MKKGNSSAKFLIELILKWWKKFVVSIWLRAGFSSKQPKLNWQYNIVFLPWCRLKSWDCVNAHYESEKGCEYIPDKFSGFESKLSKLELVLVTMWGVA